MEIKRLSVEELKPLWESLVTPDGTMPMFSYEWYQTWLTINTEWEPYPLLINGKTIAPFVKQGENIEFPHAFTDFNDLIGEKHDVWPSILPYLAQNGITTNHFENVRETSETVSFFKQFTNKNPLFSLIPEKTAPAVVLPSDFSTYLNSPILQTKRKKYRRFIREYPDAKLTFSMNPTAEMELLFQLMKLSDKKRASFSEKKATFFREMTSNCAPYVKLALLIVSNKIIAAQLLFSHNQQLMAYNSGYDLTFPNSGTFLTMECIKYAIENGYREYNFLIGRENYKYEFGATDNVLYTINGSLTH